MNAILLDRSEWILDPMKAVGAQLRVIIRSRIISNDLRPYSRISEAEIAREYDVSRQPVREAFITLIEEGLLEIRPQRGTLVRKIDCAAVLDARFVREAVEADIIKIVATKPPPSLIKDLREQLNEQMLVANTAPQQFMELDETFHRTLAEAAGKSKAWTFIDVIKLQMDRVRYLTMNEFPIKKLIHQHTLIVDALERGDKAEAEQAMRFHLREILTTLPKVLTLYPDYFENTDYHIVLSTHSDDV